MALADGLYGLGIGRAVVPRIAPPSGANNVQPFRPRGMEAAPIARPQLPPMPPNPLPMVVDRLRSAGAALLRLVRDFFAQLWGQRNINREKAPLEQGLLWEGTTNSAIVLRITKVIKGGKSIHCHSSGLSAEGGSGSYQSTEYAYGKSVSVKRGRAVATSSCTGTSTAEYVSLGLEIVAAAEPEYGDPGGTSEVSVGQYWNGHGVGTWQSIRPQIVYFTVDSVMVGPNNVFEDPSLWQPISFDWPLEPLSFVPKPIEPAEAEPEPARRPVRRPVLPPMPLPSRPPGAPTRPPTAPPGTTPSQPRPLAPPAPQPNQPAPTRPSPTPQAPPADAEVLRIQEIIRRVAPPITTTATPVSPAGPQTQTVTNSGTVVDPAPAPTPQTPTDARQYGTTTITSGAPRVDPAAVAEELGRVEQKLGRLVAGMDRTPDWLDSLLAALLQQLIPALLDALKVDVPADTWEFSAPCDRDENGEPITHTVELPGEDFPEATITRLNEIAQVLQVLKDWRQPLCRGQNVLSNVTVTAFEVPEGE